MTQHAKESEVKAGMTLVLDDGFTCIEAGPVVIEQDEDGLFFRCCQGKHYLDGQWEDGEYVGVTVPT